MALPTASDNVFPKIILSAETEPATPDAGEAKLFLDTSDSLLKWKDDGGTVYPIGTAPTNIEDYATAETDDSLVLAADGAGGVEFRAETGGGGVTTVDQDISGDFTTASDSAWHDITGLTGIVLAAGTWVGFVDLEVNHSAAFGPVFRVYDGTTVYAQMGFLRNAPVATVSTHLVFNMKPTVLASGATVRIQVFSDTAFTVQKYPTRGADTTIVATHATFMKIA